MNIFKLISISYRALMRNKTRALLTMLGIVIGIASVITMVSVGQSSSSNIRNEISSTGSNMIFISPGNLESGGVNMGFSDAKSLTEDDVSALKEKAAYLDGVSAAVSSSGQLVNGSDNWPSTLQGIDVDYFKIRKLELAEGTQFSEQDVTNAKKICIVGKTVVKNLFPDGSSPIGKTIRYNKIPFKIVGVLEEKGQNQMGQDQDDVVYAPYTTVQKRILAITHVQTIYASAITEEQTDQAVAEISKILKATHKLKPTDPEDYTVRTQAEMLTMISSVTSMLTMLLAAVASISLIVGGIGIMNIMYVTVTERTKEIGLRMSIGAHNKHILLQFLSESIILSLIGGIIGVLLGLLASYIISSALTWPWIIDEFSIIGSFLVCALTGIFFGWYPAKKAAALDPINALRYE